jgi:hypothetical protein
LERFGLASARPYIHSITCSVTGTPPELAAQIQAAYPGFCSSEPYELSVPQRLRQNPCQLDSPLPASVNCTIEIKVEYFDFNGQGELLESKPKSLRASCVLFSPSATEQPQTSQEESSNTGSAGARSSELDAKDK